ncbi:MAG: enoyl-CoA hydratase/isomerase family protein [Thermoplasmatota archaeon]
MTQEPIPVLDVERRGPVAVARFANAERMNSFDVPTLKALRAQLEALDADADVRGIVLTGEGRVFCAGADLHAFRKNIEAGTIATFVRDATAEVHAIVQLFQRSATVVIAALNGVAAGGGLGLALAADARVAGPGGKLAASYFRLGLAPDGGATWLLPRLVGPQAARCFFFDNGTWDADEAHSAGAVDLVAPDDEAMLDAAVELAQQWGAWSPASREGAKRLLAASGANTLGEQLDLERNTIAASAATADFAEGVLAFLEKRPPRFS